LNPCRKTVLPRGLSIEIDFGPNRWPQRGVAGTVGAMRHTLPGLLLFVTAFVSLSCRGDRSPAGPSQGGLGVELNLEESSVNFTLRYSERSASVVRPYLAELEANLPRVLAHLDVTLSERIVGRLYSDRDTFQAATGFIGSGAALGRNLFGLAAIPYAPSDAVHEMAHVVTWQLSSPAISTTWLWESIAVYEAGSFVPPSSIPDLAAGRFPTLGELNDLFHRPSVYQVGYTITEFLTEAWGWRAVRQLVVSRGDLEASIGLTTAEFEARWRRFVESRYF
jgi:hypothetical protein